MAGALIRRHPEQDDTRALLFIAVIEGGILLAQNLDQNQKLGSEVLAYRAFLRMLYGANQAALRL